MLLLGESVWFTPSLLVLALQVFAAAASVHVVARRLAPNIVLLPNDAGAVDSLGPFALALPLMCAAWRIGWDATDVAGWTAIGGPSVIALAALGAAMCVGFARASDGANRPAQSISPIALAAWSAVGGVLLLLGAAHDLTIWAGQCAFAAGATLLWLNTPEATHAASTSAESESSRGITILLGCGALQAIAMAFVPLKFLPVSAAMAIATGVMIVAIVARLGSPTAAVRFGGWAATYGVLLGLGVMSLHHLLPTIPSAITADRYSRVLPPSRIAFGFGTFAVEAMILLLFGAAALAAPHLHARTLRKAIGALMILAAAIIAGWRLASM